MKRYLFSVAALVAASCTNESSPEVDAYSRAEVDEIKADLEQQIASLAARAAPETCAEGDVLVKGAAGWECTDDPACPPGFTYAAEGSYTVCSRDLFGVTDTMVKAGSFWIDRYEISLCPGGSAGTAPGQDTTGGACSTSGVAPQATLSWYQAAQECANAGKRLCSNAEWQTAVAGTVDPQSSEPGSNGQCVTGAAGARNAGLGTACTSRWGAQDMIGNVWEWVADWQQAGVPWQGTTDGSGVLGYQGDASYNVNGRAWTGSEWMSGLPAAMLRGSSWGGNATAGAFAISLYHGPSSTYPDIGARCCIGH